MSAKEISALYEEALQLEADMQLSRAASLYDELVNRCDSIAEWEMLKKANQGLRRIDKFRDAFALSEDELHKRLAGTFRDYHRSELAEWKECGWIDFRYVDGKKGYSILNAFNLSYHDIGLRRRNDSLTESDEKLAMFFLDLAAEFEKTRQAVEIPVRYVNPVGCVYSMKAQIKQADLPPGKTVRAWFPFPLLCPSTQDIRILSVQPTGALKRFPDVEAEVGIAYLEIPRPQKTDLTVELKVSFQAYQTDFAINANEIPPYDEQDELYRRFTKSEQHIRLTDPIRKLASSIVGNELNPYSKARKLYDWVCDNIAYNGIWTWRESLFSPYGCASEDVRKRRVGDCLSQSEFYTTLCRSAGVPARVCGGRIFQPGIKDDHFWAEVYFPNYGWMPVDVAFCEGVCLAPNLTDAQKRSLRDFFFGHLDRYRLRTHRSHAAQLLAPTKRSPRRREAFFTLPEFECGGKDIENCKVTWDCQAE